MSREVLGRILWRIFMWVFGRIGKADEGRKHGMHKAKAGDEHGWERWGGGERACLFMHRLI